MSAERDSTTRPDTMTARAAEAAGLEIPDDYQPAFNPFEPGFFDDPYAQYMAVREHNPRHQSPFGPWTLFRYDDVVKVLHDSRQSVEFEKATRTPLMEMMESLEDERLQDRRRSMLTIDPPDHTRLRKLVQKAFTPRAIRELTPRIQELVDDALDRAADAGEMDVVRDLAFPLPFVVISEMLGMPPGEDRTQLRGWSHALVKTLDPIITPEEMHAAADAAEQMDAYILDVIGQKRRNPADDMLTALIRAEDEGDVLSTEELQAQVTLLYIAGHETTVNLIGNGTLALLHDRDQLAALRDDPSLDANATEEFLRYDSPVQFSRRVIVEEVTLDAVTLDDGTTIEPLTLPEGSLAMVGLGGANRDPAHFGPDAASLRLDRDNAASHVSFGGGVHYCLGAALARLEGRIAIGTLIRRFPDVERSGDVVWNGRINLRGADSLPVTLR